MAATFPKSGGTTDGSSDFLSRWLSRGVKVNAYTLAMILIFIIAVVTRFYALGDRVMSHDESLHTYYSYLLYKDGNFAHTPLMHGPILFHAIAFSYFLFGDSDFSARVYPAVLGILMVMFPFLFQRWLGRTGALLASIMILISPLLLYHHRYIREDTPSIFFTLIMVYATFMYIDGPLNLRRKARWLYIFAASMLGSLGSKETAFMYIAVFGSVMTLYWVLRLIQHYAKRPMRSMMGYLSMPVMLGTVGALFMYAILAVAFYSFPTLEARVEHIQQQLFGGALATADFNLFLVGVLITIAFTLAVIIGTALWAFRNTSVNISLRGIIFMFVLSMIAIIGLIVIEEISKVPSRSEMLAQTSEVVTEEVRESNTVVYAVWVGSAALIALFIVMKLKGIWTTLRRFPEFDILLIMGSLLLPWMTALFTYSAYHIGGADASDYMGDGLIRILAVLIPLWLVAIVAGLLWNWKRWLIATTVFLILYVFFFTTMFTNPAGLGTGMVGSLGYWLEQQGERRGSQPQYYYQMIIMPIYEYLPMLGGFVAMLAGMVNFWGTRRNAKEAALLNAELPADDESPKEDPKRARDRVLFGPERLRRLSFILFTSWWAAFNFIAYTLAGEKMPWLGTHLTLPLIFMTAWYFGRVFEKINWAQFFSRGWLYLLLMPLFAIAVFQLIAAYADGRTPFGGLEQVQLQNTNQWLAILFMAVVIGILIFLIARRTSFRLMRAMVGLSAFVILSAMTVRTAWMASYINYDYATEYLVYAHAAPGVKQMMEQIDELTRRLPEGNNIRIAWGFNAWPVTWYFRHLTNAGYFGSSPTPSMLQDAVAVYASQDMRSSVEPLLENNYYRFEYMRMWWPSWNYYNLNTGRILEILGISTVDPNIDPNAEIVAAQRGASIRRGIWDIWWARDYTQYGLAMGENYSVDNWTPSERLYFYVRKDVAAQIWNLGVGSGSALNPLENQTANICIDNWQQIDASVIFQNPTDAGQMVRPLGMDVDAEGNVYIAEDGSNRILVYSPDGEFIRALTAPSGDTFSRPIGLEVDTASNRLYIAEFEFGRERISVIDLETNTLILQWGEPGAYGEAAQAEPTDALWGPRDIAIDANGLVYVSDTGNKRVRVYTSEGQWVRDIGSAGANLGNLNEPSGLAISADGRLFVADTWNRRISVFNTADGTPLYTFNVRAWYEDLGNRPYLSVDSERSLLYVTDPDAGRVLVYDLEGNCVGSFGMLSETPVGFNDFRVIGGIVATESGSVYVSDYQAGRVLRFEPNFEANIFDDAGLILPENTMEVIDIIDLETQESVLDEFLMTTQEVVETTETVESTPETTVEATVEPAG